MAWRHLGLHPAHTVTGLGLSPRVNSPFPFPVGEDMAGTRPPGAWGGIWAGAASGLAKFSLFSPQPGGEARVRACSFPPGGTTGPGLPLPAGLVGKGLLLFFYFYFFLVRHQGKQSHSFCNKAKRNPREQGTEPSWPQRAVFSCGSGTAPCFYLMHFIPKQNLFACDPAQEHPTWVGNPVLHSSGAAQGGCPPGHRWHPAEGWARVWGAQSSKSCVNPTHP